MTEWGEEAKEKFEAEGDWGPAAAWLSGDRRAAPACLGNAVADWVEADEGRDILVWLEVELLAEWGMAKRAKMGRCSVCLGSREWTAKNQDRRDWCRGR